MARGRSAILPVTTGYVHSINVFGLGNPNTSIELSAVINGQNSESVSVRAGAGNNAGDIEKWSASILSAYLDRRDGRSKGEVTVTYMFDVQAQANEIKSVSYSRSRTRR
jgi:hypothetical protein